MEESDELIARVSLISRAHSSPISLHDKSRCLRDLLNLRAFAITVIASLLEIMPQVNFNFVRDVLNERDSRNFSKLRIWKSIFSTNKWNKFTRTRNNVKFTFYCSIVLEIYDKMFFFGCGTRCGTRYETWNGLQYFQNVTGGRAVRRILAPALLNKICEFLWWNLLVETTI